MRIFVDLDGVYAAFDEQYEKMFGVHPRHHEDDVMWGNINGYEDFWIGIRPYDGAAKFFCDLQSLVGSNNIFILTACPKSNYKHAALHKKEWVRRHIDQDVMVLPVLGGRNKALFMHRPGDILIDDFVANIKAWRKLGGNGILHKNFTNSYNEVLEIGRRILNYGGDDE